MDRVETKTGFQTQTGFNCVQGLRAKSNELKRKRVCKRKQKKPNKQKGVETKTSSLTLTEDFKRKASANQDFKRNERNCKESKASNEKNALA